MIRSESNRKFLKRRIGMNKKYIQEVQGQQEDAKTEEVGRVSCARGAEIVGKRHKKEERSEELELLICERKE